MWVIALSLTKTLRFLKLTHHFNNFLLKAVLRLKNPYNIKVLWNTISAISFVRYGKSEISSKIFPEKKSIFAWYSDYHTIYSDCLGLWSGST